MAFPLLVLALVLGAILVIIWTQLARLRRSEFIRDYQFPPGLYEKLRERHPQLSLKECQLVGNALRHFFLAYLKSGKRFVGMPSQVVDDLWHEFILYTRDYAYFCRHAFAGFLHHTPAAGFKESEKDDQGLRRVWFQACREEHINPYEPARLPLLFAIDRKLAISGGFVYVLNAASNENEVARLAAEGITVHLADDLKPIKKKEGSAGAAYVCGGGGSSCSGSGSCGGGGCGGGS